MGGSCKGSPVSPGTQKLIVHTHGINREGDWKSSLDKYNPSLFQQEVTLHQPHPLPLPPTCGWQSQQAWGQEAKKKSHGIDYPTSRRTDHQRPARIDHIMSVVDWACCPPGTSQASTAPSILWRMESQVGEGVSSTHVPRAKGGNQQLLEGSPAMGTSSHPGQHLPKHCSTRTWKPLAVPIPFMTACHHDPKHVLNFSRAAEAAVAPQTGSPLQVTSHFRTTMGSGQAMRTLTSSAVVPFGHPLRHRTTL